MIKEAIDRILQLAAPKLASVDGVVWTNDSLEPVSPPQPTPLVCGNLAALHEFILGLGDSEVVYTPLTVHVVDHKTVEVYGPMGDKYRKREKYLVINGDIPAHKFNSWLSLEDMLVWLQSCFMDNEDRQQLLTLLSSVAETDSAKITDDGITQQVTIRTGVVTTGVQAVRPIWKLRPMRTFAEAEQPESAFLLRLRKGGQTALFEADGGAWRVAARNNIKKALSDYLEHWEIGSDTAYIVG